MPAKKETVEDVIKAAAGQIHAGSCFGWYDSTEESCNICMIFQTCKDCTVKHAEGRKLQKFCKAFDLPETPQQEEDYV